MGEKDDSRVVGKKSLYGERARLVDEKFLGTLTAVKAERLAQIEDELDRLEAPRVAKLRQMTDAELAAIDRQIAEVTAKMKKSASDRPQAKTAGSH